MSYQDADVLGAHEVQRLLRARRGEARNVVDLEQNGQRGPHGLLVVHDENLQHDSPRAFS